MGIFDFGKNYIRRTEAVVAIQKCFETFERNGFGRLPRDYRQLASELVAASWPALTAMYSGEGKVQPHALSIAAYALGKGLATHRKDDSTATWLAAALGVILKSISSENGAISLQQADAALIEPARKAFLEYGSSLPAAGAAPARRKPGSAEG